MDHIDIEKIQKLLEVAKKKHVTEFSVEAKDIKISFSFGSQPTIQYPAPMVAVAQSPVIAEREVNKAVDKKENKPTSGEKFYELKAPFVGTFYTAPAPGEPAYVKIGDKVKKGQTVGILEAMKIMNQIESDVDGEIVEVCLENESFVEFGQAIFKIKV
jgi:acetyl-CoA carboxylase biotin carboxyl carrier protein